MQLILKYCYSILMLGSLLSLSAQTNLKEITVALHWLPQAQFAGYYIGVEKGIYEKYGLDVKLIHSSPNVTSQELLLDGKADFASMFLTTAIALKSYGEPLENVCQLSQKCGMVLVTKDTTITKPSDLNGKDIGLWRSGFDEVLNAFVRENHLSVDYVLINSTINLFLFGGIDALTAMWYNEYHSILNAGINKDELNTFFFADYGLDIPEDGLYVVEDKIDSVTIDKFVKATLESWDYAFKYKNEAIGIVEHQMALSNIPFNKAHQMWMLSRINNLFIVPDKNYTQGQLLLSDFKNAYRVLSADDKIRNQFEYEDFYYGVH